MSHTPTIIFDRQDAENKRSTLEEMSETENTPIARYILEAMDRPTSKFKNFELAHTSPEFSSANKNVRDCLKELDIEFTTVN